MKISCIKCGCYFKPEKTNYICPECKTQNIKADNYIGREMTPEEQIEYDAKYNRDPMLHDQYPKDVVDVDWTMPSEMKRTNVYKKNPGFKYLYTSGIMNWLDRGHGGGFAISDELAGVIAIGGSFGAFIAMRIYKKGIEDDIVFKIAIPVGMFVQAVAIIYLLLFDLGVVK